MVSTVVLKAMADSTRMRILELLLQRTYCVRALARKLSLSESAVSQHLNVLKKAGVVCGQKRGYHMHYEVQREVLRSEAAMLCQLADMQSVSCRAACDEFEPAHCRHVK